MPVQALHAYNRAMSGIFLWSLGAYSGTLPPSCINLIKKQLKPSILGWIIMKNISLFGG